MQVAIVQTDPKFGEKEKNINQALSMMCTVKADLYVLPELFATGYNFVDVGEVAALAESFETGYTFHEMSHFANQHNCHVVYGFAELDGASFYNSAAIVGYDRFSGLYRKIHLFDREKLFFEPGNLGFRVFETKLGRIGLMICFDWYFPESARTLTLMGAQLIAHSANLVLPNCPDAMRTRCLENRVFAATADRIGIEDRGGFSLTFIGQSQVTSARGKIIHRSPSDKPEVAVLDVDLTMADDKDLNSRNNLLVDRRPEAYMCTSKK